MTRTKGSKNTVAFRDRNRVDTTSSKSIRHLAGQGSATPLEQFKATLKNQRNYLKWIETRHKDLNKARKQLNSNNRGPKDSTYGKYRWYAEQMTLLEAINAFEVFYKTTFIALGRALRRHVAPEQIKGSVDAKVLWANQGKTSFTSLIFESQLYHDLDHVDKVSAMLVNKKRYNPNNINSSNRDLVLALQAIFQLRHTLSHNQGKVTQSDASKLGVLGFKANSGEVVDPSKYALGKAVRAEMRDEATAYTNWLLRSTAKYLETRFDARTNPLSKKLRDRIVSLVGPHKDISSLKWK